MRIHTHIYAFRHVVRLTNTSQRGFFGQKNILV